ncbi:multidrug efflux MFS transporter [Siccirubricoccus sp. KC 17139]|uniref:Multidrug efflux MFS transporter n=1 Tax=Siccirubricoccus soli TaxID=2899147 RepID=A0ABT1D5P7_9PROT|nr:MDR family MFS transporter [Siccirubricoccus soli]MCO6416534.1 multidrug efflux MFS transporter [Siccirubricoccus soli]MCP2682669.1 multidrug efflux MFS transporter [Siccirubricoccus soli]
MSRSAPPTGGGKADAAAWLAVAAGTLGSLMATLDTSIVNASLPTIQGEIGASSSEGTWISTAYLVAEIVMIPLAGWLERILGLRNLLLAATILFTLFSMWCGIAENLAHMIIGRVGQGFTGGAMIPTALTIVATRLPPGQRPVGIALFGMTAVLGPVIGPVLGGWLTESFSWHYSFFINLPIGIGLLVLLLIGLPGARIRWRDFLEADVLGLIGLVLGLGGLTVVLEEGQRERWFESDFIRWLSVMALIGFACLIAGQFVARKPVINLGILLGRSFFGVFVMGLMVGAALYGILYIIPQFLVAVPGYNSQQAGLVTAISGVPTLLMLAVFPFLVRFVDVRLAVALGLLLFGASCFIDTGLTPESTGDDLFWAQVVRGFAQFFAMLFLNQAATAAVPRENADDASGLYNAARNLGGSFGLAAVSTLQDQRLTLHIDRLQESITANSVLGQEAVQRLGIAGLARSIQEQATVMTYIDLFHVFGVALIAIIPLALLLRPLPKEAGREPVA